MMDHTVTPPTSTELSMQRTRLSYERTLMSWVRTAISLISFGFTIFKFFQYMHQDDPLAETGLIGPRGFAILMICIGLAALILANIEHRRSIEVLSAQGVEPPSSLAAIVAGLIAILGVIGLLSVLFRM